MSDGKKAEFEHKNHKTVKKTLRMAEIYEALQNPCIKKGENKRMQGDKEM